MHQEQVTHRSHPPLGQDRGAKWGYILRYVGSLVFPGDQYMKSRQLATNLECVKDHASREKKLIRDRLGVKKEFSKSQQETAVLDRERNADSPIEEAGTCVLCTFVLTVIKSTWDSGSEPVPPYILPAFAKRVRTTKRP